MSETTQTHYRACHLCEAICGLEIVTKNDQILSIKGDKKDPISHGFICPKATAIADIHTDPDRIKNPMKRIGEKWIEVTWDEALRTTAEKLVATQKQHGQNSCVTCMAPRIYRKNPPVKPGAYPPPSGYYDCRAITTTMFKL